MKVERASTLTAYKNDHCAVNVPKSKDWTCRLITYVGNGEVAMIDMTRSDTARVLRKMRQK